MADQEIPALSILEQLRVQHKQFLAQKEFTQTNLNQLVGAIHACEQVIQMHEAEEAKKGEADNGNVEHKDAEQNP